MGYDTDFTGEWTITPLLTPEHSAYLQAFAGTQRMKRDAALAAQRPDPVREAVGLPIGVDGGYFVGDTANAGQNRTPDVTSYNEPPHGQPGLWCQWIPNDEGTALVWDEGENFRNYAEWVDYLIKHFLGPWGYRLDGDIEWQGEDGPDAGVLRITDNTLEVLDYARTLTPRT